MIAPSRETLEKLQPRWNYSLNSLEIVLRLLELGREITKDALLAECLVLKGGTALNLGFPPLLRLSVDLDFNVMAGPDREAMLRLRPEIVRSIERLARRAGYAIQRSREEHAGQKFYLRYPSALGTEGRVQVDLNFLFRVPIDPAVRRELWHPVDEERFSMPIIAVSELVSGKVLALLDRAAPRDLFDVAHMEERMGHEMDAGRTRRVFVALAGTLNRPLWEYGFHRLARVTERAVRASLHPVLPMDHRPSGEELRTRAWAAIAPWLVLTEAEREYTERLQRGELRPELVFPDDGALVERLARHPALLWKAENARQHAARQA